jgi:hypothetical protein
VAPRQIGFEFVVDGATRHGVITVEAVASLFAAGIPENEDAFLRAVATSPYIAKEAANRVRLGLGGDARRPVFLSTVNFA